MVAFGKVKEPELELIEPGEYVLTLDDIEESEGNWGDRLVWKFLVAPQTAPTEYITRKGGDVRSVWVFTDADIVVGGMAHQMIEKMTGTTLEKDDDPPAPDALLGTRILGYITHHTPKQGKNAGKKQEQIVSGSFKSFKLPGSARNGAGAAARAAAPAADQITADASAEDIERMSLVTKLSAQVVKLKRLDPDAGAAAAQTVAASDLAEAPLAELERLLGEVNGAVTAALDA